MISIDEPAFASRMRSLFQPKVGWPATTTLAYGSNAASMIASAPPKLKPFSVIVVMRQLSNSLATAIACAMSETAPRMMLVCGDSMPVSTQPPFASGRWPERPKPRKSKPQTLQPVRAQLSMMSCCEL